MRSVTRVTAPLFLSLTAVLIACKDSAPPELSAPAKLVLVAGNGQSAVNGPAQAGSPLVVKVLDPKDRPVRRVTVNWATSDAGGSVNPASTTTGDDGTAQTTWTLGTAAGRQSVTATSPSIPGASVVFTGTNNVIAITGAVSIASSLPVAFSAAPAASGGRLGNASPLSPGTGIYDAAAVARALAQSPAPTRRVIVRFRGSAAGVSGHVVTARSEIEHSVMSMRQALAPLMSLNALTKIEPSPAILATRVTLAPDVALADGIAALRSTSGVESVEIDEIVPMLEPYRAEPVDVGGRYGPMAAPPSALGIVGTLPGEPILWPTMWHYNLVEAPRAWTAQTGSANVLVAVVDDGIRFDHPAMATCTSYASCTAGNLTTDGYNFVTGGPRLSSEQPVCQGGATTINEAGYGPDPTQPDDLTFTGTCWSRSTLGNHGLHVAGTIGARGNDGVGIAGLNWTVKIRPVRVLDMTGSGSDFDVAQGVLYAAGLPASDGRGGTVTAPSRAPIINMSLGRSGTSTTLASAVTAATNAGSLIVAAAGNSASGSGFFIPASYPEVVAVSAVGPDLQLAWYTNIGSNVSLSAPGGNSRSSGSAGVASSTWNFVAGAPSYAYYQGTSMAAPHVAGVAALVLAANPGFTNAQIRARLQSTALHMGSPGRDDRWGYGIVNAYRAVNNMTSPIRSAYVHVINSATGDAVKRVPVSPDGAFSATGLAPASYWVVAGQDEDGDGKIGRPGRRFGWFGPAGSPTAITVSATQSGSAAVLVGTPVEAKPNGTVATANRVVVDGWVLGQLNATYGSAYFAVQIPRTATYTFAVDAAIGACGYGIELDPVLTLFSTDGTTPIDENDDVDRAGGNYCSRISRTMTAGLYYLRVTGYDGSSGGQFALHVREGT